MSPIAGRIDLTISGKADKMKLARRQIRASFKGYSFLILLEGHVFGSP
jgi:hypothetical protein